MNRPVPPFPAVERSLLRRFDRSGAGVARAGGLPAFATFDWLALAFWLTYFAVYSAVGWTVVQVGQCIELWCR
jgi:hypothetical protein